jgi:predicted nuclease of predicted toxin-antitoxin system
MLYESSRRNQDVVLVTKRNQFHQSLARHQTEGPACELKGINIVTHRLENILEMSFAEQ